MADKGVPPSSVPAASVVDPWQKVVRFRFARDGEPGALIADPEGSVVLWYAVDQARAADARRIRELEAALLEAKELYDANHG